MMIIGEREPRLENPKDYSLTVKVDKEMFSCLQKCADTHHMSKAEYVRMAIQHYMDLEN